MEVWGLLPVVKRVPVVVGVQQQPGVVAVLLGWQQVVVLVAVRARQVLAGEVYKVHLHLVLVVVLVFVVLVLVVVALEACSVLG